MGLMDFCTFAMADDSAGQNTMVFVYSDWPSQSIVLILTVPFTGTERIVSTHPCSSVW